MSQQSEPVLFLYDSEQRLQGVLVSPEFWELIKDRVCPLLPAAAPAAVPELPEPLADWETLGAYWDFTYPLSSEVSCGQCGQHSADWQADEAPQVPAAHRHPGRAGHLPVPAVQGENHQASFQGQGSTPRRKPITRPRTPS